MGLFEKLFPARKEKKLEKEGWTQFKTLTAYQPAFRTFRGAIYENELIRAAIDTRARHISKLSVEMVGPAKPVLQTKLKIQPNPYQRRSRKPTIRRDSDFRELVRQVRLVRPVRRSRLQSPAPKPGRLTGC